MKDIVLFNNTWAPSKQENIKKRYGSILFLILTISVAWCSRGNEESPRWDKEITPTEVDSSLWNWWRVSWTAITSNKAWNTWEASGQNSVTHWTEWNWKQSVSIQSEKEITNSQRGQLRYQTALLMGKLNPNKIIWKRIDWDYYLQWIWKLHIAIHQSERVQWRADVTIRIAYPKSEWAWDLVIGNTILKPNKNKEYVLYIQDMTSITQGRYCHKADWVSVKRSMNLGEKELTDTGMSEIYDLIIHKLVLLQPL